MLDINGEIFVFLSFTSVLKHVVHYLWRERLPQDVKYVGKVSDLFIHPIKSAQGIQLEQAECTPVAMRHGSLFDRYKIIKYINNLLYSCIGLLLINMNGPRNSCGKPHVISDFADIAFEYIGSVNNI